MIISTLNFGQPPPPAADAEPLFHEAREAQTAGDDAKARTCYRQIVERWPAIAEAWTNLGALHETSGELEEAEACHRRAIGLRPASAPAWCNLGLALYKQGAVTEAIACYEKSIALSKHRDFHAHSNLAHALLSLGDLRRGFAENEWRFADAWLPTPRWNGHHAAGKQILFVMEQGLGDTLQFVRYLPVLQRAGCEAMLTCQPELQRLLAHSFPEHRIVARGGKPPPHQVWYPLLSLPHACGTTLETVPAEVPYLHADAAGVERWRQRLGDAPGRKVGLVWAGSPGKSEDWRRSLTFADFAPVLATPDVRFYSLQLGRSGREAAGTPVQDFTAELHDFAETAALIAQLDLVVTVDTAAAHLAGAMGKPVWILLPFSPDWRWLRQRSDSPWYPTARLFRQPARGQWEPVVRAVAEALAAWARA